MKDLKDLPNISEEIAQYLSSKITSSGGSLYASMLGDPCERYLYHHMVDWRLAKPKTPEMQSLLDLGRHLEDLAKQRLRDLGYEVFDHGDTLDEHGIRGRMDCFISGEAKRLPGPKGQPLKNVPVEIKFLSAYADKYETIWDLLNSDKRWIRRYPGQLLFYMYARNSQLGLFLFFNKMNAWPQHIWVDFYQPGLLEIMEGLIQKADRVHAAVKAGTPPPWIDSKEGWCFDCEFVHICNPPMFFGEGAKFMDDPKIVQLLDRREEIAPYNTEYLKINEELKKIFYGVESAVCGPWIIEGKSVEKKGYEVRATTYWSWKARKIGLETKNGRELE